MTGTTRRMAFLALIVSSCALAVMALNRHVDPDLFWHLRGGSDILAAGRIALPDSWTYLFAGKPWVNQQWAAEILLYGFFRLGGYAGLEAMKGLVACAIALFIVGALPGKTHAVRLACVAIFFAGDLHYFIFRTHIFSLLCMAALVFLLERLNARSRLGWIVLLFALWANVHTLFSLGLIVLGWWVLVRWIEGGRRFDAEALWGWASLPLAFVATFANPYGWDGWLTAFTVSDDPATMLVTEWWPLWRHSWGQNLGFYFIVALVVFLMVLFPRRVHWPSLMASGSIAVLGVLHVRFVSDAPLPAVPLLASLLAAAGEALGQERAGRMVRRGLPLATGAMVVFCAAALSFWLSHPLVTPGERLNIDYPVGAASFMRRNRLAGRIFNEYNWGGYLCWALPESRTFIDPRTGVLLFPRGFVGEWKDAVETQPGWRKTLELGHPDFALLFANGYLAVQLASEPGWEPLYRDEMSVLFGRRKAEPATRIEK